MRRSFALLLSSFTSVFVVFTFNIILTGQRAQFEQSYLYIFINNPQAFIPLFQLFLDNMLSIVNTNQLGVEDWFAYFAKIVLPVGFTIGTLGMVLTGAGKVMKDIPVTEQEKIKQGWEPEKPTLFDHARKLPVGIMPSGVPARYHSYVPPKPSWQLQAEWIERQEQKAIVRFVNWWRHPLKKFKSSVEDSNKISKRQEEVILKMRKNWKSSKSVKVL